MVLTVATDGDVEAVAGAVDELGGSVLEKLRFDMLEISISEDRIADLDELNAVTSMNAEGELRFAAGRGSEGN
ncbi:hypothetical protein SAMN05443636_1163 [Halobaculum gomorrense]|uniref:Putative peptidase inhibitor domain-containing protein n=2 Tax=Halobaculum gomorrense TaxID=43928 RepID=A0A1M5MVG8_9EURY|nr:hypothetical protein SAMN05443636_1163 [Halobaculum gomorrense]